MFYFPLGHVALLSTTKGPSMRNLWVVAFFPSLALVGCAVAPVAITDAGSSSPGTAFRGTVHGGQQPIMGASVYLYAASTMGYGKASISLLTSKSNTTADSNGNYFVTTDPNGNFNISNDYTCPSTTSQVYLYSVGGDPGSGMNSGAGLMAALGTCPAGGTLSSSLYVVMNEVSTVATAYAIAGYATDATHVSSPDSALATAGIADAFASVANRETLSTGVALATTPAGNGTVPQSEINTLANILAACINSNGAVTGPPSTTPCYDLFDGQYGVLTGATKPTDTATAAINIAHNPWAFVSSLFGLQTAASPFAPSLSAAPNDFTIAISYTGSGLSGPAGLAVDGSGNIWVADFAGSGLSEFSPNGAPLSGAGGFGSGGLNGPVSIAIDSSGNAWVTNYEGASVSNFNSSGSPIAGSPYTSGGLNSPWGIAIDQSGHTWVTNEGGSSISGFTSGGSPITGSSGITTGGLNYPVDLAVDVSGNIWVANGHAYSISEFNSSGTANANSPFTGGGLIAPGGIAIDGSGNVWAGNAYPGNNTLSELNSSGTPVSSSSGYSGGGLATPFFVAIDGAGNVWVANNSGNSISEFAPTGTQICNAHSLFTCPSGYTGGGLNGPFALAIDGAGNIWVTDYGNYLGPSLTEFVGAAAPVATPVVANLLAPCGTHAVNLP